MRSIKFICLSLFIFAAVSNVADGYKILGIFPTPSKSHFIIGDALMRSLAVKGHEVTVISPYPMNNKNYRGIELKHLIPAFNDVAGDFIDMRRLSSSQMLVLIFEMGLLSTNCTLSDPLVQKLIETKEHFDLIVIDHFYDEALFGFSEIFKAPLVAIGMFGAIEANTELVGTPSPPSYVTSPFHLYSDRMSLFERIGNLALLTTSKLLFDYSYFPRQEKLLKKYFPSISKNLDEIRKNTALVLLNSHVSFGFPRPYLPNMIEVGGLHINRMRNPLPVHMKKFIDDAKDGVIYFSMGSNLKSKNLPADKLNAILRTFKSLKQRVLWKFEDENLPNKSDNVFISDWFPQDDILAHPNVKLSITHGGMLSTTESIYHGKPMIGIPMLGDQFFNMMRVTSRGIGLTVDYYQLTEESFKSAITEILNNSKYTQKVQEVSARFHDQPLEPMELAIYWIEYVVKHKGAPHLHCAAQELSFVQYHNIDAIVIVFGGLLLVLFIIVLLAYAILLRIFKSKPKTKTS